MGQSTEELKQALALITAAGDRTHPEIWLSAVEQTTISDDRMIRVLALLGRSIVGSYAAAVGKSVDQMLANIGETLTLHEDEEG
jgi:hypothetical protein